MGWGLKRGKSLMGAYKGKIGLMGLTGGEIGQMGAYKGEIGLGAYKMKMAASVQSFVTNKVTDFYMPPDFKIVTFVAVSGCGRAYNLRLIDSCITQLKAQGPSRTCNKSKEEKRRRRGLQGEVYES